MLQAQYIPQYYSGTFSLWIEGGGKNECCLTSTTQSQKEWFRRLWISILKGIGCLLLRNRLMSNQKMYKKDIKGTLPMYSSDNHTLSLSVKKFWKNCQLVYWEIWYNSLQYKVGEPFKLPRRWRLKYYTYAISHVSMTKGLSSLF